ncbi:SEC-C metal-binding domain-containing protein [uncultured Shewanella sp.]|uniref:SEC-C metal-binding domain-containing protein n=1 Tax=uncultured Shewanella sp. TaxID=173975 RepID=UPI0026382801|nr:SEC-C metal-binding domain-containing protein [uncultured Shewanella sp.]
MRRILATDFGIWPSIRDVESISNIMIHSKDSWSSLANYILLYDQLVIPTGNFQILSVLKIMLGEDILYELINNNVIVLARYDKWFSYSGSNIASGQGSGLRFYQYAPNTDTLLSGYFKSLDEALNIGVSYSNLKNHKGLSNAILDKAIPVTKNLKMIDFREETYRDILDSPYFKDFLSIRNRGVSLNKLNGIKKNSIKIYNPHTSNDDSKSAEIWSVLRAAFENFLLTIAIDSEVNEIRGDNYTLASFNAKGQRLGASIEGEKAFIQIQEISGVPNIGHAFATKNFSATQLLDLRESKHSQNFRNWFSSNNTENSSEIVQQYVANINKPSLINKLPIKLLRFATTLGISSLEPISGAITSSIDSFILDKISSKNAPKLFLEQAKTMQLKSKEKKVEAYKPKNSGRDRNRLCSCGSEKKFKKCCGA